MSGDGRARLAVGLVLGELQGRVLEATSGLDVEQLLLRLVSEEVLCLFGRLFLEGRVCVEVGEGGTAQFVETGGVCGGGVGEQQVGVGGVGV